MEDMEIAAHVFVLVRYATSIINPLLYTFFRRDFNKALKSLFKRKRPQRFSRDSDVNRQILTKDGDDTAENIV